MAQTSTESRDVSPWEPTPQLIDKMTDILAPVASVAGQLVNLNGIETREAETYLWISRQIQAAIDLIREYEEHPEPGMALTDARDGEAH